MHKHGHFTRGVLLVALDVVERSAGLGKTHFPATSNLPPNGHGPASNNDLIVGFAFAMLPTRPSVKSP